MDNSSDVEDSEIEGPGSIRVETRMSLVREIIPNKHGGKSDRANSQESSKC